MGVSSIPDRQISILLQVLQFLFIWYSLRTFSQVVRNPDIGHGKQLLFVFQHLLCSQYNICGSIGKFEKYYRLIHYCIIQKCHLHILSFQWNIAGFQLQNVWQLLFPVTSDLRQRVEIIIEIVCCRLALLSFSLFSLVDWAIKIITCIAISSLLVSFWQLHSRVQDLVCGFPMQHDWKISWLFRFFVTWIARPNDAIT